MKLKSEPDILFAGSFFARAEKNPASAFLFPGQSGRKN